MILLFVLCALPWGADVLGLLYSASKNCLKAPEEWFESAVGGLNWERKGLGNTYLPTFSTIQAMRIVLFNSCVKGIKKLGNKKKLKIRKWRETWRCWRLLFLWEVSTHFKTTGYEEWRHTSSHFLKVQFSLTYLFLLPSVFAKLKPVTSLCSWLSVRGLG